MLVRVAPVRQRLGRAVHGGGRPTPVTRRTRWCKSAMRSAICTKIHSLAGGLSNGFDGRLETLDKATLAGITPDSGKSAAGAAQDHLAHVAKAIGDLNALVSALANGLPRVKPWQRQFAARLGEVDSLLQILRMTVSLDRLDSEVHQAADRLWAECNGVLLAIAGSRSDLTTKAAARLMAQLATSIRHRLAAVENSPVSRADTGRA